MIKNMNLQDNYDQEEINLHRAVQLLSLTGVNLLPALPDDSQNTVVWNEKSHTILGRVFELNKKQYQMGIRLTPFELILLNNNQETINSIDIGGLDQPALYSIWEDWLINLGFKGDLITKLHYELPENDHYRSNQFNGITAEFANTWSDLRTIINTAMENLNKLSDITSEINIWPHHFDTGVYYSVTEVNNETTQSIGAGLAIADAMVNEPYFYLYGWTKEGKLEYNNAPDLGSGNWLTQGWQGAVLNVSNFNTLEEVNSFFKSSYKFLLVQLKKNESNLEWSSIGRK